MNNMAHSNGGGICLQQSIITFNSIGNIRFIGNYANYTGGGIWARASSMNFSRNLTFYSNHAQVYGGGVYAEDSNLYFMGSTFHFNVAVLAGGIIYSQNTTISFTGNNILSCNSAGAYGGAVYSYASSFVFSNTY